MRKNLDRRIKIASDYAHPPRVSHCVRLVVLVMLFLEACWLYYKLL